jgi:hypothetical protein
MNSTRRPSKYKNPNSPMHGWPLDVGDDDATEAFCPHGVGHPIPEALERGPYSGVHTCDGCCLRRKQP